MTLLQSARAGQITDEIKFVASVENLSPEFIRKNLAKGRIVIPSNIQHKPKPIGIGYKLKTKVNANIGTSANSDEDEELEKLKAAIDAGSHTVMDLSTHGNISRIRENIIFNSQIPIGTVPIYQVMHEADNGIDISIDPMLKAIELHAKQGVDFITIHAGLLKSAIPLIKGRLAGVVSRGGSFMVKWMTHNEKENPLYTHFDSILDICQKYDVTLSLGDGLRPGSIHDATDKAQIHELKILGKLTKEAWKKNVQVMVEGPGHVPINQIKKNMQLQKKYCHNAPFYVLGPLVTDIAPGYDHITSAIGGAIAAYHGADFLCYVTRTEHLSLPKAKDVREAVIVSRIAAHAADIANGKSSDWDNNISKARMDLNWKKQLDLAIDPKKAKKIRSEFKHGDEEVCTMCGKFCSINTNKEFK